MHYDELISRLRNGTRMPMIQALMNEAADAIEELESSKWISVGDLMPAEETDVLVMFEHNMAVANWDGSAWMVNSGDGWCTGISLDDDEKEPTHWMPLPEPPNCGADFVASEWYQIHVHAERHHLLSHCPDDVTLIDVMEMLVDCVCAGMARSGEVRNLEISDEIMSAAVKNTVDLIKSMIVVEADQ